MHGIKTYLKLRDQQLKIIIYIKIAIQKSHGNCKTKIYTIYTKSKRDPKIILKIVIKSQEMRTKDEERGKRDLQNNPKTMNKMAVRAYISIITLNVNGLKAPTKRHILAE